MSLSSLLHHEIEVLKMRMEKKDSQIDTMKKIIEIQAQKIFLLENIILNGRKKHGPTEN